MAGEIQWTAPSAACGPSSSCINNLNLGGSTKPFFGSQP
jgi:hypothetical protein